MRITEALQLSDHIRRKGSNTAIIMDDYVALSDEQWQADDWEVLGPSIQLQTQRLLSAMELRSVIENYNSKVVTDQILNDLGMKE